jgi:predicted ATPase
MVRTGDLDAGLGHIKGLIAEMNAGRARLPAPLDLAFFADALAANEEYDAALLQLADALKLIQRTGERFWEPEIHRLQGEFLWRNGSSTIEEIKERFVVAIEESQSIAAKALELRAASSLARLMFENGDTSGARRFLEPVYNWFTEGHDTPDMKNAKKLLEAMA